jgi:hypothetical protein
MLEYGARHNLLSVFVQVAFHRRIGKSYVVKFNEIHGKEIIVNFTFAE